MYKEKILYLIACTLFELPLLIFIYLAVKSKKQETKGHETEEGSRATNWRPGRVRGQNT